MALSLVMQFKFLVSCAHADNGTDRPFMHTATPGGGGLHGDIKGLRLLKEKMREWGLPSWNHWSALAVNPFSPIKQGTCKEDPLKRTASGESEGQLPFKPIGRCRSWPSFLSEILSNSQWEEGEAELHRLSYFQIFSEVVGYVSAAAHWWYHGEVAIMKDSIYCQRNYIDPESIWPFRFEFPPIEASNCLWGKRKAWGFYICFVSSQSSCQYVVSMKRSMWNL